MYNNHHIQFSPIPVPDNHIQHMLLLLCSSCQRLLLLPMDGHSMLVMSATLDSRVTLVLFYLQAAQSISAIQNVSRVHFPPEFAPSIGLHLPCIQSNDLSYTVFVCQVSSPMNGANTYIIEPTMQICCSFIAVCAIEWVVSTSHIFIEESEGRLS